MKKILIIQTASIGDVILATPLIEKLYDIFDDVLIDFLLKKGNESLFSRHPKLNKVIVLDKNTKKIQNLFKTFELIRNTKYDYIINIQRFASSGLLTAFSGAKQTIGFKKNPFSIFFNKRIRHIIDKKTGIHEVERNLKLIESFTSKDKYQVKLYPSKKDFAKMSQYKTNSYICISPASLWFTKQYPIEKWIEFVKEIPKNYYIYFLGSKADFELCDKIIKDSDLKNTLNFAGKLSFLESAALMRDAHMNFVNDSAPMHLASAMNAPISAIFCSTIPDFGFGPLSVNSAVIEIDHDLYCRPCGLHGHNRCPKKHFKCAYEIKKEQLLKRI
ncbi:MAG: glycosyltransferase family 9 protein [Bacteroidales bacterium]|nr:glycosyltransferase family 9 protein [Bacteroidales bacterium]